MGRAEDRVRAAVAAHCAARHDSRTLRARVLTELRRVMSFDWYVWLATDPRSEVGIDPLAEVPDLRRLPTVIALKYATRVNRWTGLTSAANLGARAAESRLWREVQADAGVVDVASVVFNDRFGCWGFLDLWSTTTFGADQLRLLADLIPGLTRALRGCQADRLRHRPEVSAPVQRPAVVLLDDGLTVTGLTPPASAVLSQLLPRPDGGPTVPAAAYNVAAQLLANETGVDDHPPEGRVHLSAGHWLTIRASRLDPGDSIAVSLEPLTPPDRLDLCVRAFGLSAREAEVVTAVAAGGTSVGISHDLHLSGYTVQDHLKSIFAKSGVGSRRELVPLLLGSEAPQ